MFVFLIITNTGSLVNLAYLVVHRMLLTVALCMCVCLSVWLSQRLFKTLHICLNIGIRIPALI